MKTGTQYKRFVDTSSLASTLFVAGLAALSSGCVANDSRTVYDNPTLRPGETVFCESSPCSVYFETPAGTGTHTVIEGSGSTKAGEAVGGQKVFLGEFFGGEKIFTVEGTDLPPAYLTVPTR